MNSDLSLKIGPGMGFFDPPSELIFADFSSPPPEGPVWAVRFMNICGLWQVDFSKFLRE
jgi:hypothetical protein